MVWKFHAMLHHAGYVRRYGWAPHTLTMERKHKTIMRYAEDCHIHQGHVLREVLASSLTVLSDAPWLDMSIGLVGCDGDGNGTSARVSEHDIVHTGDIAAIRIGVCGWQLVRVLELCSTGNALFSVVQPYTRLTFGDPQHSTWKLNGETRIVLFCDFKEVLIFRGSADADEVTVLYTPGIV